MAVPTLISQLSQTASLNSPGGGEAPFPDADDFIRALSAFIAILRDSGHQWVTSISGTDTITGSVASGLAAYVAGQKFSFVVAGTNTGTTPTVNFNSLGSKSITRPDGAAIAVGELKGVVHLVYTGSAMQLMGSTRATSADTATTATTATSATTAGTASAAPYSGLTGVPANIAAVAGTDSIQKMSLVTAVASTSGTAVDFTGIPSWAKKLTISFNGVSTNGSSAVTVQVGAGSIDTTGYAGSSGYTGSSSAAGLMTNGFATETASGPSVIRHGQCVLTHMGGNLWAFSSVQGRSDSAYMHIGGGTKSLSGVLDRLRITATNLTDTFDAGSISLLVEGY